MTVRGQVLSELKKTRRLKTAQTVVSLMGQQKDNDRLWKLNEFRHRRIAARQDCLVSGKTVDPTEYDLDLTGDQEMNLDLSEKTTNITVSSMDEATEIVNRATDAPAQVVSSPREAGPGPRPEPAPVATPTDEERAYEHHRNNERIVADQSRRIEEVQRENDRLREEMRDERKQLEELKKNGVGGDVHNPNPAWTSVREDSPLTKIPIVEKLVGG